MKGFHSKLEGVSSALMKVLDESITTQSDYEMSQSQSITETSACHSDSTIDKFNSQSESINKSSDNHPYSTNEKPFSQTDVHQTQVVLDVLSTTTTFSDTLLSRVDLMCDVMSSDDEDDAQVWRWALEGWEGEFMLVLVDSSCLFACKWCATEMWNM